MPASPNTTTATSAFMARLLEPLPAEELMDGLFGHAIRRDRRQAWRLAEIRTGYFRAKANWQNARDTYRVWFEGAPVTGYCQQTVADLRRAIAEQILTPAPDKAAVKWKKVQSTDEFLPIEAAQMERAIADDEAWLAAHPAKRSRRGEV